ncbi:MAG: tetratricopeptide repeat protein [Kofleriaceae bacterium]
MPADTSFASLRRLADWFATSTHRGAGHLRQLIGRTGPSAIPLLTRELQHGDQRRREAARTGLAMIAARSPAVRDRVIRGLREVTDQATTDEAKVCALGLLAELGARGAAQFADPIAVQRRSAIALASQLSSDADVAEAADLMVRQLDDDDIVQMIEVMRDTAPPAARRLGNELVLRLDLAIETRDRIEAILEASPRVAAPPAPRTGRPPRPTHVVLLLDPTGRLVVLATRKNSGERRWRRWAVLIGTMGHIDDCVHEDDALDDAAPLLTALCRDGYQISSRELDDARAAIMAAARRTASTQDGALQLPSAYYLGRDLLELGDAHIATRVSPAATALGRAIELIADGEPVRALGLLEQCDPDVADVAAARAACLLAQRQFGPAAAALEQAIAMEPDWPLHHWNHAVALHEQGDAIGCHDALRRFVTTSGTASAHRSGLRADPEQPARLAHATRMIAELERTARLNGISLGRRRRRAPTKKTQPAVT